MNNLTWAIILLLAALAGVVLRKTYFYVPPRELKRRAERGDADARQLYRAVAFGNSLRTLLWLYIGLAVAASLTLLARDMPLWLSLVIVGPLLWIVFSLIPASRSTRLGLTLTKIATPVIAWLLNYVHPLLGRGADAVEKRYVQTVHTRLFEKEDLIELIERQHHQLDSRVSDEELEIARRALTFGEYHVADILTPRKQIKTLLADEVVGPILIDEVHKSGQSSVLVKESKKGPVIGSLSANQLSIHSKGKVGDIMTPKAYYLHENDSLTDALHAFFVTNQPLFVVVNSFEEYVGIVTVENIIKHLMGHLPGDDFDQYTDLAAVAARHPKKSKKETTEQPEEKVPEDIGPVDK